MSDWSPSVLPLPLLLLVLASCPSPAPATPNRSYTVVDPNTQKPVECDGCPPGTHLVSRCTATQPTECARCPAGSFTEVWNTIEECNRCRTCDWNQVVKSECRAERDRGCRCQAGYYLEEELDACLPLRRCPSGEGVLHTGTAVADTECQPCPVGTFSDQNSAAQPCRKHRRCEATAGLQRLLAGTSWHDSICVKCEDDQAAAMEHLRPVLPVFFTHHRIPHRLLRRFLLKIQLNSDQTQRSSGDLQAKINTWLSTATAVQLEEVPSILQETGAVHTAERLLKKLQLVKQNVKRVCG